MSLSFVIAYLHILTLGIGFYAIWARASALKKLKDNAGLSEVFKADNFWGLAALSWIITGLWRVFGGLEKGTDYYLHSTAFIIKMGLFLLVFILELKPMITLIQWRIKNKKGHPIDFAQARLFALLSHIELGLLSIILLFAIAMARGVWY
jgi:putative membrane protein